MESFNRERTTYNKAVGISEPTLSRLKSYCYPRGLKQGAMADEAINEWLDRHDVSSSTDQAENLRKQMRGELDPLKAS